MLNRFSERSVKAEDSIKALCGSMTLVQSVDCDLQSLSAVRRAADKVTQISAQYGGLDVLCNNAGIMMFPDVRTEDGFEVQMQVNHISHVLLTKLLMPSLEAAASSRGEARVVYHSSGARNMHRDLDKRYFDRSPELTLGGNSWYHKSVRYSMTKLANAAFAMELHSQLQQRGSKVPTL